MKPREALHALLFVATAIGVPMVNLVLGRPLVPALALSWGYPVAVTTFAVLVKLPTALAYAKEVEWDSDKLRAWSDEQHKNRPWWLRALWQIASLGFWVTTALAIGWGGLP